MSWRITPEGNATTVELDSEMGIQNAADFHQALLPLAGSDQIVRVDARAVKAIHSSILQILYALSQAVSDFQVTDASNDFRAAEVRMGLFLGRTSGTAARRPLAA